MQSEFLHAHNGGSKFLIPRLVCCLWFWRVSSGQWQRQQILNFLKELRPLIEACFLRSTPVAANSWFLGVIAAFEWDVFLRIDAGGSKFLIPKRVCCLCSWRVSSGQWRRQQILDLKTCMLPLLLMGFIGSIAEAANSWFQGVFAAFALGEFHRVNGGGSKFLIPRHACCLCSWRASSSQWQRQQIPDSEACMLPLILADSSWQSFFQTCLCATA